MAKHSLMQAVRMDPQSAAAHEALGYCLFRMRDFAAAELSYKQALAYNWRLPRTHAGLGSILMLRYLKLSPASRSEAPFPSHLAKGGKSGVGRYTKAQSAPTDPTRSELRDRALEHWHRSLELNPNQPRIRKLIAQYKPKPADPEQTLLGE